MNQEEEKKIIEKVLSPAGSLGQLALGAVGLRAWRKMRSESNVFSKKEQKSNVKKK